MGSQSLSDRLLSTFCFCFVSSQPKSYHLTSRDNSELQRLDGDEEEEDWDDWAQSRNSEVQPVSSKPEIQGTASIATKETHRPTSAPKESIGVSSRTLGSPAVIPPQPTRPQFEEASDSDESFEQRRHKRDGNPEDDELDEDDDDDFEVLDLTTQPFKKEQRQPYVVPRVEPGFSDSPSVSVAPHTSASYASTRTGTVSSLDGAGSQSKQPISFASSSMPRVNSGKLNPPPPPPAVSSQTKLILGHKEEIAASDDIDIFSELGMEPEIKAPKVIVAPAIKKETFSSALSAPEDLGDLSAWD